MLFEMVKPNSWTYASLLKSARRTKLLISRSLSGADRAVALIIVDVCISVSFLMQRCPATMLHTSNGKYVCLCSWPTCKHGKCGCFNFILYLSRKYLATVHSTVCPFSNCNGNLLARIRKDQKIELERCVHARTYGEHGELTIAFELVVVLHCTHGTSVASCRNV